MVTAAGRGRPAFIFSHRASSLHWPPAVVGLLLNCCWHSNMKSNTVKCWLTSLQTVVLFLAGSCKQRAKCAAFCRIDPVVLNGQSRMWTGNSLVYNRAVQYCTAIKSQWFSLLNWFCFLILFVCFLVKLQKDSGINEIIKMFYLFFEEKYQTNFRLENEVQLVMRMKTPVAASG